MDIQIISTPFELEIYGFGATTINKEYVQTAFNLSAKTWAVVKNNSILNKGKNCWVYSFGEHVFAGVELINNDDGYKYQLERMLIQCDLYAYYKHVGPYSLIKQAGTTMTDELIKLGYTTKSPYIEIYGHWTNNESLLETELIMNLQ